LVAVAALPDFSAAGILRSELDEKLNAHVSTYLKNTTVRTNVLTRIAIMGAVRSPGFYYAPPDRPLSDLVMLAGGPGADANLNEIELIRGGTSLLSSKDSRALLKDGRTLEQVDVQSGDEVRISAKRRIPWSTIVRSLLLVASLTFAILQFLISYYARQER
jgi:protein involved in polysaccharide export with SLBB domain